MTILAYSWSFTSLAFCVLAFTSAADNPFRLFDEGSLGTWFNALQILACAATSIWLYRIRRLADGAVIWLILAAGSMYLAADELLEFHEHKGMFLRFARDCLHLRIGNAAVVGGVRFPDYSDLILVAYGLAAASVAWCFRKELMSGLAASRSCLVGGLLLCLSFAIDSNVLHSVVPAMNLHGPNLHLLEAWEESFKILGFAGILTGLLLRLSHARNTAGQNAEPRPRAAVPAR